MYKEFIYKLLLSVIENSHVVFINDSQFAITLNRIFALYRGIELENIQQIHTMLASLRDIILLQTSLKDQEALKNIGY